MKCKLIFTSPPEKQNQKLHQHASGWQQIVSESRKKLKCFAETCWMVTRHRPARSKSQILQALSDGPVKKVSDPSITCCSTSQTPTLQPPSQLWWTTLQGEKHLNKTREAKKHILKNMGIQLASKPQDRQEHNLKDKSIPFFFGTHKTSAKVL